MEYMRKFLKDQRGVSPVIGVILMVAVTVVLGAVIAGFAFGYIGVTPKAPSVALSIIDDPNDQASILIKHSGGEAIGASEWKCSVTAGKESTADFTSQTETGAVAVSTGTVLDVDSETDGVTDITTGWYHIVVVHIGSDAILLDTNVQVR